MKFIWKLLVIILLLLYSTAAGTRPRSVAYVVDTDTSRSTLGSDTLIVDFLRAPYPFGMGWEVTVRTYNATWPDTTDGFIASNILGSSRAMTIFRTTTKGVVNFTRWQQSYLGLGKVIYVGNISQPFNLLRSTPTHFTQRYIRDSMKVFSDNLTAYMPGRLASGVVKMWNTSTWATHDTTMSCLADVGSMVWNSGGTAEEAANGRRVHLGGVLNSSQGWSRLGYCDGYRILAFGAAWAFGDTTNQYLFNFNCAQGETYMRQCWTELSPNTYIYENGRLNIDNGLSQLFWRIDDIDAYISPGRVLDSLVWVYPFWTYGVDAPPFYYDTVTVTGSGTGYITYDTLTTHATFRKSKYTLLASGDLGVRGLGETNLSVLHKAGTPANLDTTLYINKDTIRVFHSNLTFSVNDQVVLKASDIYSGFDMKAAVHGIKKDTVWTCPTVGGPQGNPDAYGFVNRYNIINRTNPLPDVSWSAMDLVSGVDYYAEELDTFRLNAVTFPERTGEIRFNIPGSAFATDTNGFVVIVTQRSNGNDSTDIEIVPRSLADCTQSPTQKFLMYLSPTSAPQIGVYPTSIIVGGTVNGSITGGNIDVTNQVSGAMTYSVTNDSTWLTATCTGNPSCSAPSAISYSFSYGSRLAGIYKDTIRVASTGATNTPVKVPVTMTLSVAATTFTAPIKSGYRK